MSNERSENTEIIQHFKPSFSFIPHSGFAPHTQIVYLDAAKGNYTSGYKLPQSSQIPSPSTLLKTWLKPDYYQI